MSIEDSLIRRQILNQRFTNGQAIKAQKELARFYETINARLLREPTEFQTDRLVRLRKDLDIMLSMGFGEFTSDITSEVIEFAESEVVFSHKAFNLNTIPELQLPAIHQIEQFILETGMDAPVGPGQLTINQAMRQFTFNKSQEIRNVIGDGILAGDTTQEVTRQVSELAKHRHKAQAAALVKTSINHAASQARKRVAAENASIFSGDEWVSVLDDSTTLICGGRDGRIYPVNKGPFPPAHWNCRSLRIPVVKPEFARGSQSAVRPSVGPKGAKQVSGSVKFDGWMRSQPASFQDEYFSQFTDGKEKAALFRRGDLKIQQFRDETGKNYTLEQLKALEPLAFEKANLNTGPLGGVN